LTGALKKDSIQRTLFTVSPQMPTRLDPTIGPARDHLDRRPVGSILTAMQTSLRRLRATLIIALTWALVWLPMGFALALYAGSRPPQPSDVISRPVALPAFVTAWTIWGAISGGVFAFVLTVTERRRTIETLSTARTAVWGALGAVALPLVLVALDLVRTPVGVARV
jgi:hypothetical protein